MTPKEQLLQELSEAHERLIAAAATALRRGVVQEGERWGPREVMAHIVGWEANALVRVPKIVAGAERLEYDNDAFNTAILTVLGNQSFDAVRDLLRKTYQRDVEMLRALDESNFVPGNYAYERTKAAIRHNYEHAQELDSVVEVCRDRRKQPGGKTAPNATIPPEEWARKSGEERLRILLMDVLCVSEQELTRSASFVEDLDADPLDLLEIYSVIGEEFHLKISFEDAEKITTVGEAQDYLKAKGVL